jgi:hypothetical protein
VSRDCGRLVNEIPNGDPAAIIDRALGLLWEQVSREKLAQVKRPRKRVATGRGARTSETANERATSASPGRESRHIPSEVKRAVWKRDGGQCALVSKGGRRCSERGRLWNQELALERVGWKTGHHVPSPEESSESRGTR